jgi:hypothetical protein
MTVPLLLRLVCSVHLLWCRWQIESKWKTQLKDTNTLLDIQSCNTLVTSIGGDLVRMGGNAYEQVDERE